MILTKSNLEKADTEDLAFRDLRSYIGIQYPGYRFSRHNRLIAEKLMKLETGEIRRLMIFMPPRHGKTFMVSEFFPAWYIGRNPDHQIIAATYSYERGADVGRKVRNQLLTEEHQRVFKGCHISMDSKSANKFSTVQGGNYYSVGVSGAIVGRGAHLFLIDDPIKGRQDAESLTSRKKMSEWFKAVAYTRLMPDNRIVLIMTRWHFDDLAGFLLEEGKEEWDLLSLPAISEIDDPYTQRKRGDALWPTDYPVSTLLQIKSTIGSREWNSQFQQRPLDEEGGMIKISWFQRYDYRKITEYDVVSKIHGDVPTIKPFGIFQIVLSWDTAFKEAQLNDPSSCTVWGVSRTGYYLLYVFNRRVGFPELKRMAVNMYERYRGYQMGTVVVLIEDRASGQSLIQVLKAETNITVIPIKTELNKQIRMAEISPVMESGRVYIPQEAPWLIRYETQMAQFPLGKEDDDADSTSQFLRWASKPKYKRRKMRFYK